MELVTSGQIYWLTRLDSLEGLFMTMTILGMVVTIVGSIIMFAMYSGGDSREADMMKKLVKRITFPAAIIGILGITFVPTTKEAAAIVAIPIIVNNPQIQSLGTNTLNIAEIGVQYLKETLTEKSGESK